MAKLRTLSIPVPRFLSISSSCKQTPKNNHKNKKERQKKQWRRFYIEQYSTFSAWATVLGNPSRMKPFWHFGLFMASSIIPTTSSSVTSAPCKKEQWKQWANKDVSQRRKIKKKKEETLSIASLALRPRGVLEATAALNMSPVDKWHKQNSSFTIGDCVPFPDPGGPVITKKTKLSQTSTLHPRNHTCTFKGTTQRPEFSPNIFGIVLNLCDRTK